MARGRRRPSDEEELLRASWSRFVKEFPTDEACVISLQGDARSPCCMLPQPAETLGQRKYSCSGCKKLVWVTARNFFENIKEPFLWRGAIYLKEDGLSPTPADLQRLTGAAYSSCWEACRKLDKVVADQLSEGTESIDTSLCLELVFRRTRMTPAGKHPHFEQSEFDSEDDVPLLTHSANERAILESLTEQSLSIDVLCQCTGLPIGELSASLTMLELSGCVERLPGDRYSRVIQRAKVDCPLPMKTAIVAFVNFVRAKFQGVGRKYLQLYAAGHACRLNRDLWGRGRLLNACLNSRKIRRKDLLDYVTPQSMLMSLV